MTPPDSNVPAIQALLQQVSGSFEDHQEHLQRVAQGGAGSIHAVRDERLQRQVAVKVLHRHLINDEEHVRRFIREAQITAQLDHPTIVPVHELRHGAPAGLTFSMKLVEGRTLSEMARSMPPGPLNPAELGALLEVVLRVCDGLAFAHSRGVLHCDIKPQNVLVGDYGQVYLMDWGIAALFKPEHASGRRVKALEVPVDEDVLVGTPSYMSPEQARNAPLDVRSDVFLMGALLYYVLGRRAPYRARNVVMRVVQASRVQHTPIEDLCPDIAPALLNIIHRAMARSPADRYPSIDALQEDLRRFLRGSMDFPKVTVPAGFYIVRQGEPGDTAYILLSGRCRIFRQVGDQEVELHTMESGVFGEMSVLTGQGRTANVQATEESVLLEITRGVFDQELNSMKPWMSTFMRTLAERFRKREMEGFAGLRVGDELLGRQAGLYLMALGETDGAGRKGLPLSELVRRLAGDLAYSPERVEELLSVHPDVHIEGRLAWWSGGAAALP